MVLLRSVSSSAVAGASSSGAPGGASQHAQRIANYVDKLPSPLPTGVATTDANNNATQPILCELLTGLLSDRSLVLPVYNEYKKLREEAEDAATYKGDDSFASLTTLGRLEPEFAINFLTSVSDMTTKDILAAKAFDDEAVSQFLEMATGKQSSLRLPAELRIKAVCLKLLKECSDQAGNPLRTFKADGGLKMNGEIDWTKGVYRCEEDEQSTIISISYLGKDKRDTSGDGLVKGFVLMYNWSQWRAALAKPPYPPIRIASLFEQSKSGPWADSGKPWSAKTKEFTNLVAKLAAEHEEQKSKLTPARDSQVQNDLKELESKKRRASMQKARDQAQEKMQQKRQRQQVTLGKK